MQSVVNGRRGVDVHARSPQQRNRIGGTAAAEETEIVLYCRLTLPQNTLGKSNSTGKTSGILIHIEIIVEMRDSSPLQSDFRIRLDVFTIV